MESTYDYSGQNDLLKDSFESTPVNAGFWLRFAAYIIDTIVMYAISTVLFLVFGVGSFLMTPENPGLSSMQILILLLSTVIVVLYFVILESSGWQATLGKKAVGIKVTDLDGNRISPARALGRYLAKILSAMILLIGFLMVGFTERKQGLHDIIAGTLVVKA